MKVLELFGGIGACSKALENLGVDFTIVDYVEIDKYAVKSFNAMHGTNFEPQDITTWDKDLDVDLIMHGSPCQDFSLAGKQAGGDKDSGTRSSLMYETIRIVEKLKPKYVIWENVKNLLSTKHKHNFDAYLEKMEKLGYKNYYQVLNAKDYGIPQNRERVFTVSIRNDINRVYMFPAKKELKLRLKDMLEEDVDKKYYLTDSMIKNYQRDFGSKGKELNINDIAPTLVASMGTGGGNTPYFTFPPKQELKTKLKDLLEDNVDEKYYLSEETTAKIQSDLIHKDTLMVDLSQWRREGHPREYNDISPTLSSRDYKEPRCVQVKNKLTKEQYFSHYSEGDNITITCDFLDYINEFLEQSKMLARLKKYITMERSTYVTNSTLDDLLKIIDGQDITHHLERRDYAN